MRSSILATAVAVLSLVVGLPGAEPSGAAGPRLVLVSGGAGPAAADKPIQSLLVARGYSVTVVDDDAFDPGDTSGASGVIVSSSVAPTKIGGFLKSSTLPVVTWEPFIYPTLGLTGGGAARGESTSSAAISIVAPAHPIAAGLSGTVTVASAPSVQSFGLPGMSSTVVARGQAGFPVVFAYESGAALAGGGVAPARRVGLFPSASTPPNLTPAGQAIIAAGVTWALGSRTGDPPPVVSAGPDRQVVAGQAAALDGTVSDNGPVTARWTQTAGPAPASISSPTAVDTSVRASTPGSYEFTLTVSDGTSSISDTMQVLVRSAGNSGPSTFVIWHGDGATVRRSGWPQVRADIIGRVTDPDGVVSLSYSLDGGAAVAMGLGPNGRRLVAAGDFVVDLPVASLGVGSHSVRLRATDTTGAVTERTVAFTVTGGAAVPIPFSTSWAAGVGSQAVVIDGQWRSVAGRLENSAAGYDRLVAIGDRTWTDYEVVFGFTVRSLASSPGPHSGTPAVGVIAKWNGHNNTITPGSQPLQGFRPLAGSPTPFGAILWWNAGHLRVLNQTVSIVRSVPSVPTVVGSALRMRIQVDQQGSKTLYRARMWAAAQAEPTAWQLEWLSPGRADEPRSGSLVLVAHEALVSFDDVTVTRIA